MRHKESTVTKIPQILVVGSMNTDLFIQGANEVAELGQSLSCRSYGYAPGGKGANQALAAARLGANVVMVGRVGADANGKELKENLKQSGVNVEYVVTDEDAPTGLALLLIDKEGRYRCYTVAGANAHLNEEDVKMAMDSAYFDMVVLQLEMPLETVYRTCELAAERGIPVFLDAGPAMKIPLERLQGLTILSPNEAETEALTGICPRTQAEAAAKWLYDRAKPQYVILKLGERGALLYDGKQTEMIPAFKVEAVDSTAAGDTFGAALAIRLCEGAGIRTAIRFGNGAAGICVSRMGAQTSIPARDEVDAFLASVE